MDDHRRMVAHGKIHEGWLDVAKRRTVPRKPPAGPHALTDAAGAKALDTEASAHWGLDPFALVEAAGRACAHVFTRSTLARSGSRIFHQREFIVLAGSGNNAADALVMLRALVLGGHAEPGSCLVLVCRLPEDDGTAGRTPLSQAVVAIRKLGVRVKAWDAGKPALASAGPHRILIDGIAGTGLDGPLRGAALEMAEAANVLGREPGNGTTVVSIDIPSGAFDGWRPGMPIVAARGTLAIEPRKLCLYTPAIRPNAGAILPVGGIFPAELVGKYRDAELLSWENAAAGIGPVPPTAHKYMRGLVEIRAGSKGATGAARLAALGSQAAGAGMVRLIVDPSLYAIMASACSGVMVAPATAEDTGKEGRFSPAAVLLGPGWGRGDDRMRLLESCLPFEKQGRPLVLDADAIDLAKDAVFHGNAIMTPHVGEFAACTGFSKDEILSDPAWVLRGFAAEKQATVLLKSHVMYVASPDGRLGIIDGMNPVLAAGGSGDVLAGFCAAIAARGVQDGNRFDGYACACAAASLLVRAADSKGIANSFVDPEKLVHAAAAIAGGAWIRREK